jgi:serine/threonine-protein kinase
VPYWKAPTVSGIISQILFEPMTAPSARGNQLGTEFDLWFLRACSRSPDGRFGSAVEQIEALARVFGVPADARTEPFRSNPGESDPGASPGLGLAPTVVQSGGTLVSSSSETPERSVAATTFYPRRVILSSVAIGAMLLAGSVALLKLRQPSPEAAVATGPAPVDATVASVPGASAEAAAAAPTTIDSATSERPETHPPSPSGVPLTKQKEPPKGARSAAPSSSSTSGKPTPLDPLGDQK